MSALETERLLVTELVRDEAGYDCGPLELYPDPWLTGVWAVRSPDGCDFLVNIGERSVEDCEFKSWPPTSER